MKRILKYYLLLLTLVSMQALKAQDPHFSQYFASPLTLNPANTGFFDGEHRVASNIRQQSIGAGAIFRTATVSYDTKLLTGKLDEYDQWGVGVLVLNDQSSAGALRNNILSVSTSYRKTLDEDGLHSLGIGFQGSYADKYLDMTRLSFASQFTNGGFDIQLPSGEGAAFQRSKYWDAQVGFLYAYRDELLNVYAGASLYHISQPRQGFLDNEPTNRLPRRTSIQAGMAQMHNDNQWMLSGLYMNQGGVNEMVVGGAYGLNWGVEGEDKYLYAGAWYRMSGDVYPYIGLQWGSFQGGLSYDIALPSSGMAGQQRMQSLELSLIYSFRKDPAASFRLPCSKF